MESDDKQELLYHDNGMLKIDYEELESSSRKLKNLNCSVDLVNFAVEEVLHRSIVDVEHDGPMFRAALLNLFGGEQLSLEAIADEYGIRLHHLKPIHASLSTSLTRGYEKLLAKFEKNKQMQQEKAERKEKRQQVRDVKQQIKEERKQEEKKRRHEWRAKLQKKAIELDLRQKTIRGMSITIKKYRKRRHMKEMKALRMSITSKPRKAVSEGLYKDPNCSAWEDALKLLIKQQSYSYDDCLPSSIANEPSSSRTNQCRQASSLFENWSEVKPPLYSINLDNVAANAGKHSIPFENFTGCHRQQMVRSKKVNNGRKRSAPVEAQNDFLSPAKRRDVELWVRRSYVERPDAVQEDEEGTSVQFFQPNIAKSKLKTDSPANSKTKLDVSEKDISKQAADVSDTTVESNINGDAVHKPRRYRRLKQPIPEYWKEYPLGLDFGMRSSFFTFLHYVNDEDENILVEGILDTVLQRCADSDLHKRLFAALSEFIHTEITIPDVTEKHSVVLTTFRRYWMIFRDALSDALGADELCPSLAPYLTPTTSFDEFNKFLIGDITESTNAKQNCLVENAEKNQSLLLNALLNSENAKTEEEKMSEKLTSPFIPLAERAKLIRCDFTGTTSELHAKITSILHGRHTGDLNVIANLVIGTIAKEVHLRKAMEKANISLEQLLAAYNFCGRKIAIDNLTITDMDTMFCSSNDCKPSIKRFKHDTTSTLSGLFAASNNPLDAVSHQLLDAYTGVSLEKQLKGVIRYAVIIGYRRPVSDKERLSSCLECILIDGLSLDTALSEHPELRHLVVSDYSKRCRKVHTFLLDALPRLFEKVKTNKLIKMNPTSTLANTLVADDASLIKNFLHELKTLNCNPCKELALCIAKRCAEVKLANVLSSCPLKMTPKLNLEWLEANDIDYTTY